MNYSWRTTGNIKPQKMTESRLQLHYAIQFIAAIGSALAEPLPDYSHTSLEWNPELNVFVGSVIRAKIPFRVALDPIHLTSIILDQQGNSIAEFPLHQKTMAEGLSWHKQEVSKLGADADKVAFLSYPPNDFPDHPVAHGSPFDASEESAWQELTNYYANTHHLLQQIIAKTEYALSIHIWPHHFDIATLISLPGTKNGEPMSIGIGLSPGDSSYEEPYWYVSLYPYLEMENLPTLYGNGFWHTQHWLGAVLTASRLATPTEGDGDIKAAETQKQQVEAFLNSALQKSQVLLKMDEIGKTGACQRE
ncbi:hypothetical protein [Allocoleopsis sp.]|uniref:hypothetical protein n=1 Tax=Allocoleopsis sp. TaxID=3088169 RepID=UPI002FD6333C